MIWTTVLVFSLSYLFILITLSLRKLISSLKNGQKKLAFFHPFCNDGGGGEKVLWCIIEALLKQEEYQSPQNTNNIPQIAVYSLENDFDLISVKVKNRFNINISQYKEKIKIIHIPGRYLLTPKPKFTMLCQIILPLLYCLKCLWKYQPDVFYDTTGFAYNFIAVKLFMLPVTQCHAYIHYPFISVDMVNKIESRKADFNNNSEISKSKVKTKMKIIYYKAILLSYKAVNFFVDRIQANSTWTYNHMKQLWGRNNKIIKLYPPCSIDNLLQFKKDYKQNNIISLAQFRPEKNHALQIRVIQKITKKLNQPIHLYICGSTRGEEDQNLLKGLQNMVAQMELQNNITFCVNMKFSDLLQKFKECQLGIHSMQAEHFGISIVQMLAAGCIVIAHNSAGPKFDIIQNQNYLSQTEDEYEEKLYNLINLQKEEKQQLVVQFRQKIKQFGEKDFRKNIRQIYYGKKNNSIKSE